MALVVACSRLRSSVDLVAGRSEMALVVLL